MLDETLQTAQATVHDMAAAGHEATKQALTQTNTFVAWVKSFLTWGNLFRVIGIGLVILLMWIIYKLITRAINKVPAERMNAQRNMVLNKLFKYIFYIIVVVYILSCFGIRLSALLGAAGVVGIAVGFAAQTSVSNLISGIFVLSEGVMKVGDFVSVGGESGTVESVDLLSVKIRTLDNQIIRVPNSTVINTNLTNFSYFDKRRMVFSAFCNYDTNVKEALKVLAKSADLCPTVLKDPKPSVWVDGFGDSCINLSIAVWFRPADIMQTKNDMFPAILKVFDDAKIDVPYNRIEVSVCDSFDEPAPAAKKSIAKAPAAGIRRTAKKNGKKA